MTKKFSKFMSQGKVKTAIQHGTAMSLDDVIQSGNVQTTVQGQLPHPETVLCSPSQSKSLILPYLIDWMVK